MGTLRYVTFTGVDERTNFNHLVEMVEAAGDGARFIEFGVLYAPSQAGQGGRYPSLEWLEDFAEKANKAEFNIALHFCGKSVKNLLESVRGTSRTVEVKRLFNLAEKFGRVQLNTRGKEADEYVFKQLISQLVRSENRTRVILQWNDANAALCRRLTHEHGFETLVDGSGGRGIVPDTWPVLSPLDGRRIGYAGGLGPDNIAEHLPTLYRAADDRTFWLDMEQSLRDENDNFVVERCQKVLEEVVNYDQSVRYARGLKHGQGRRPVSKLSGLWLDWWVGYSRGYPMVVPPQDAIKAMYLYRQHGTYESYTPSDCGPSEVVRLMQQERIGVAPCGDDRWKSVSDSGPEMTGPSPELALLRAVVAKAFGETVPCNPADI